MYGPYHLPFFLPAFLLSATTHYENLIIHEIKLKPLFCKFN